MTELILIDSGFLRVLYDAKHPNYPAAHEVMGLRGAIPVVPDLVLTEAAYLFRRDGGILAVVRFLDSLHIAHPRLECTTYDDLTRARDIMAIYTEAKLDFVDCSLMAMAERLNIVKVCTFDHRDFMIFRPKHCDYLEILP